MDSTVKNCIITGQLNTFVARTSTAGERKGTVVVKANKTKHRTQLIARYQCKLTPSSSHQPAKLASSPLTDAAPVLLCKSNKTKQACCWWLANSFEFVFVRSSQVRWPVKNCVECILWEVGDEQRAVWFIQPTTTHYHFINIRRSNKSISPFSAVAFDKIGKRLRTPA